MSVCTFLAADCELPEKMRPSSEFRVEIDTKKGTIYDGDRDDNFALYNFGDVGNYSDLQHGVIIEWFYCTPGRAKEIIKYIRFALMKCDRVELWTVWLMDYYEYDERPLYKKREISIKELTAEDIMEIAGANVWGDSNVRPTYYCLTVRK